MENNSRSWVIFALCVAIEVMAPIICFINYFERNRALHLASWVLAALSIPATLAATYILTNFQSLLPSFCIITLLAKTDKQSPSPAIAFLKYVVILFTLLSAAQILNENYLEQYYTPAQLEQYTLLAFNLALFFAAYRFLRVVARNGVLKTRPFARLAFCFGIGVAAFALHITYLFSYAYIRGNDIAFDSVLAAIKARYTILFLGYTCVSGVVAYLLFAFFNRTELKTT